MASKKASLTLRLELRTIQPPANGKYVFIDICDAEDVVCTARSRPLRRSRSHKNHLQRESGSVVRSTGEALAEPF